MAKGRGDAHQIKGENPIKETIMRDAHLERLLTALDAIAGWNPEPLAEEQAQADIALAEMRLQCLRRRLGSAVEVSPYLRFLNRCVESVAEPALAASA